MRLLSHLLATDVRQFRWTIVGWCVLLGFQAAIVAALPSMAGETPVETAVALAASLLWFAVHILTIVLVPLIVQAHAAVGTQAFWMTRPIPPGQLAASKTILLGGLIIAVPCAIELVHTRTCRLAR